MKNRIAEALGWTLEEVNGFSLQALRELVAPVKPKLAAEITAAIQSGNYIFERLE